MRRRGGIIERKCIQKRRLPPPRLRILRASAGKLRHEFQTVPTAMGAAAHHLWRWISFQGITVTPLRRWPVWPPKTILGSNFKWGAVLPT